MIPTLYVFVLLAKCTTQTTCVNVNVSSLLNVDLDSNITITGHRPVENLAVQKYSHIAKVSGILGEYKIHEMNKRHLCPDDKPKFEQYLKMR